MRDITFRAWDIVDKKYYFEIETTIYFDEMFFNQERYIVEQYTGLKDKNSVEIYEGDIVEPVEEDVDFEYEYYQIVYNETGDYPAFDLKGWTGEINGISELSLTCGIEVIGNIHENADLLEE